MFRHIGLTKKSKISKTKKLPLKPPKNQKLKKEYSSELMLKTKNVQTQQISKQKFSKKSKTEKLLPKLPKTKNERISVENNKCSDTLG